MPSSELMPTISEAKESLKSTVLDSYLDEYKEYVANRRNLETKAQGNVAIAGIFIAGVFALITKSDFRLNEVERFVLLLAMGFLVSSIVFSILVLQARTVPSPPLGSFIDYSVKHLLKIDDTEFYERLQLFSNDHMNRWRMVMSKTDKEIKLKANRLWVAQVLLVIAILSAALLAIVKVIS
jgi:hypothetical protein